MTNRIEGGSYKLMCSFLIIFQSIFFHRPKIKEVQFGVSLEMEIFVYLTRKLFYEFEYLKIPLN